MIDGWRDEEGKDRDKEESRNIVGKSGKETSKEEKKRVDHEEREGEVQEKNRRRERKPHI